MKPLTVALALITLAVVASAFATDVGLSVSIGEPGFYGQIDIGSVGQPRLVNSRPTVLESRYRNEQPLYLRVPAAHAGNWRRYCTRYDACQRPVYFVRDDWYRNVYAPHYRSEHGNGNPGNGHGDHQNDRHDEHHDNGRDEHHDNR